MQGHIRNHQDMLNKVSRRYLLKNSAIAATGAALLPSFITGCSKDGSNTTAARTPNLGGEELADHELRKAAENLTNLRALLVEKYSAEVEYESIVFNALNATVQNGGWTNFFADLFVDIAILAAAFVALSLGPAAALALPALAFLSAFLHDWGIGKDRPTTLSGTLTTFSYWHLTVNSAILDRLTFLENSEDRYRNLRDAWKDTITFNGETYTIGHLARSHFPQSNEAGYTEMKEGMLTAFYMSVWNMAIVKCCKYYYNGSLLIGLTADQHFPEWAQKYWYPTHPGQYLRGVYYDSLFSSKRVIQVGSFNLGINGYELPPEACSILFKDDTPYHEINNAGLFNRDYVFKQFSATKYTRFLEWREIGCNQNEDFCDDLHDWDFEGGLLKKLKQ